MTKVITLPLAFATILIMFLAWMVYNSLKKEQEWRDKYDDLQKGGDNE